MKITRQSVLAASTLAIGAFLGASALVTLAQTGNWTAPTATPPGNNTPAPINVGNVTPSLQVAQTRNGNLQINGILGIVGNLIVATGSPSVGSVLTSADGLGTAKWTSNFVVVPNFDGKIRCPAANGVFGNAGDSGQGPANDYNWQCSGGYAVAFSDGNHTPSNTTDSFARCGNASWYYTSEGGGNDINFYCQSAGGYLTAMCNNNFACPPNATTVHPPGTGVYCNWTGYDLYAASGKPDSSIDCENNYVVGTYQEGQVPPAYTQQYKLQPQ